MLHLALNVAILCVRLKAKMDTFGVVLAIQSARMFYGMNLNRVIKLKISFYSGMISNGGSSYESKYSNYKRRL